MLVTPNLACPAESGLDLVEDQLGTVVVADPPNGRQVALGRNGHPERCRDGFEHHCGGCPCDGVCHGVDVVERHLGESARIRAERIPVLGITCGKRKPRMPVIAALCRNDIGTACGGPCNLDGQIDRLTTGHSVDDSGELVVCRGAETHCKLGSQGCGEMVVADVCNAER